MVAKNPYLGIAAILKGIGLVTIGSHTVTAGPALTPFNFKVKECKVDTSPNPVSCKDIKNMLKGLTFDVELQQTGFSQQPRFVVFFTPTEPTPSP